MNDFYKYEYVTNVEIASMTTANQSHKFVTFPAVTICTHKFFFVGEKTNGSQSENHVEIIHDMDLKPFILFADYTNEVNGTVSVLDRLEYFDEPSLDTSCVRFDGVVYEPVYSCKADLYFEIAINTNASFFQSIFYFDKTLFITDNYKKSLLKSDYMVLDGDKRYEVIAENTLHMHKLGEPYNRCSRSVSSTYRQINCIEECINNEIKTNYNCSIPSYFKVNSLEHCFERKEHLIYTTFKEALDFNTFALVANHTKSRKRLIDEYYQFCEKKCPKECFMSKWNTPKKVRIVNNTKVFRLKVLLAEYSPLNITEIPKMTGFDLISDIGGTLSLFIGISFFSVVELFEFLIDVFYAIISVKLN